MTVLSTSVVISFSDPSLEGDGLFSAEVDSREDGYNGGKTSFIKGDSPVVLLFATYNIAITRILQSEGTYTELGFGTFSFEESLGFANTRAESLSKPYHAGFEIVGSMPALASWELRDNALVLPANVVAAVNVRYTTFFRAYRITNVSGDYPVIMYFEGMTV